MTVISDRNITLINNKLTNQKQQMEINQKFAILTYSICEVFRILAHYMA